MNDSYPDWLHRAVPTLSTQQTKLSELRRIERAYGDLDDLYDTDELAGLLEELTYTSRDQRENVPNPSRLEIVGDLRNNLASYKSAVQKYVRFRQDVEIEAVRHSTPTDENVDIESGQQFSLEKDLQRVLRDNIAQLEEGLQIIDGGMERNVPSGRIDILARDTRGREVVIELKAVLARDKVLAQIAAYMGDRIGDGAAEVRGIIVAPDFHPKLLSACRVAPSIQLVKYSFKFQFDRLES